MNWLAAAAACEKDYNRLLIRYWATGGDWNKLNGLGPGRTNNGRNVEPQNGRSRITVDWQDNRGARNSLNDDTALRLFLSKGSAPVCHRCYRA